jgi:uroporphyrinogen-III synthase
MPGPRDIGVLVTRPEPQAMPLCRLLEAAGLRTVVFPALEIRAHGDRRSLQARVGPVAGYDLVIFVSANAVRFGAALLDQQRDLRLAAVGPATARALNHAGYRVSLLPSDGFDSEGLLAHRDLQRLEGQRILLIKGTGGRELLQAELARRGARVVSAEVYERQPLQPPPAVLDALERRFAAGEIGVVTATSLEIGAQLLQMATPGLRREFARAHWLVPGERVAAGLRGLGLVAPLLLAASAEDQSLAAEILRWRSSVSGA